nr:hypothetical protein [Thiobacillaceae bacterium]
MQWSSRLSPGVAAMTSPRKPGRLWKEVEVDAALTINPSVKRKTQPPEQFAAASEVVMTGGGSLYWDVSIHLYTCQS